MTWRDATAIPAFDGDSGLGSNYQYVIRIPAATDTDAYTRLRLRGPATGQSRIQAMWLGYAGTGDAYDFSTTPVQVKVANSGSFTLAAGSTVYSDALTLALDTTKDIVVAYELLSGDTYKRANSAAGFSFHYKSGTGDAATQNKSSYTTTSSKSAIVETVQVTDDPNSSEPPPPPSGETGMDIDQVLQGQRYVSAVDLVGETGKYAHFQFLNPENNTKVGLLYSVVITPDADTVVSVRSYNTALANAMSTACNVRFGAGGVTMSCKYQNTTSILGNVHGMYRLKANEPYTIKSDTPLIALDEGRGTVIVLHEAGVGAVCNIEWREIAE